MPQHIGLHGVEGLRRIRKPPGRKMLFDLPQKHVALVVASKFNGHAALVVRRFGGRGAKPAATQSPQPRQRGPSQLINHGWLGLGGGKTSQITRPKANTIKSPITSATKNSRQLAAPDLSLSRRASRQARNASTTRGNRNPQVATAASSRPQRTALRTEPAPAWESTVTSLDIQVHHFQRVVLDELTARFHVFSHKGGENIFCRNGVFELHLQQRTRVRVHGGVPKLLGVHFPQTLKSRDGEVFLGVFHHVVEYVGC